MTSVQPQPDPNMQPDPYSKAMIALAQSPNPPIGFNLDPVICPAHIAYVDDVCTSVTVLEGDRTYPGNLLIRPYVENVPMPATADNFVEQPYDLKAVVKVVTKQGQLVRTFELVNPKLLADGTWTCTKGAWFEPYVPFSRPWPSWTATGGGVSVAKHTVTFAELNAGELTHSLMCTLPGRLFGDLNSNACYCCGEATGILYGDPGCPKDLSAWGAGVRIILDPTISLPKSLSVQAQRIVNCLQHPALGVVLVDRSTEEAVAIACDNDSRWVSSGLQREMFDLVHLSDFYVTPIGTRYNYHTKVYP